MIALDRRSSPGTRRSAILQTFVTAARSSLLRSPTGFSGPTLLAGGVVLSVAVASFMRAPLLPDIGRDLRITAADIAMITTAFALGRLVMDLPAGRLADRLPAGRALAGSGVGVAISAAAARHRPVPRLRRWPACSSSASRRR